RGEDQVDGAAGGQRPEGPFGECHDLSLRDLGDLEVVGDAEPADRGHVDPVRLDALLDLLVQLVDVRGDHADVFGTGGPDGGPDRADGGHDRGVGQLADLLA